MNIDKNSKEFKIFIKNATNLNIDDFVRYEIENTHYIIQVTANKKGFSCELLYSPNGVDDISEYVFVNKDEIPKTIENLIKHIKEEI